MPFIKLDHLMKLWIISTFKHAHFGIISFRHFLK